MSRSEGKYAAVLAERNLPKAPPADAGWQARIDATKANILTRDATRMAEAYVEHRRRKAAIEETLGQLNTVIAAYEQLLAESQEQGAEGWGAYGVKPNAIRLATGETVRVTREPQAKVVDKEAFRRWAIANGYESQLQLMWQTTNGIVKERLLAGEPEPPGTEAYSYTKIVLVKGGDE